MYRSQRSAMTFLTMVSKGVLLEHIQFHTLPQEKQRTGMIILPNVVEDAVRNVAGCELMSRNLF
jgi:hypothetical protein